MSVRAFAERVLVGDTLDDKLGAPDDLDDRDPGPPLRALPAAPGRPPGLRLDDPRPRPPPPRRADLDREDGRGRVLHTFANHELLALELMALMLLRFPDAPAGWRRGLVSTMRDEQRHLAAYLDRAAACGVEPGEVPVSAFFWDALHRAADPLAFTAGMGLGLEQANLDFARWWSPAFHRAGDVDTAAVLDEVYADEVRHVRVAAGAYRRLSGHALTFDAWARQLVFPMSPARARGPVVDRDGRAQAGLPAGFVDALEVAGTSRGRPPVVYAFRAAVEDEVAGRAPGAAARAVQADLQHLPLLVAGQEDALIASPPSSAHLQRLRAAGFAPCQVVSHAPALAGRPVGRLAPWGWSPAVGRDLAPLAPDAIAGPVAWDPAWAVLSRKDDACRWPHGPLGAVACTSLDAVHAALPGGPWVIKAALSASGTRRVRGEGAEVPAAVARWLAEDGAVVVQRWLDRVLDVSSHGDVDHDGPRFRGLVRFETGAAGVFRGAYLGDWLHGAPREVARFAHADGAGHIAGALEAAWTQVATRAHALGYRGPLGVDAMIARVDGALALVPVVEVNPRWTMGRIALALRARIAGRSAGWWRFAPVRALRREHGDVAAWAAAQEAARPVVRRRGLIAAGFVPTNDPATATAVLTWLDVRAR